MAKKRSMFKLSKKDKKVLKTVAIGIGVVALVGASAKTAQRLRR